MEEIVSECAQHLRNLGLYERAKRLTQSMESGPAALFDAVSAALAIVRDLTYFAVHKDNGCSDAARKFVAAAQASLIKARTMLQARLDAWQEDMRLAEEPPLIPEPDPSPEPKGT